MPRRRRCRPTGIDVHCLDFPLSQSLLRSQSLFSAFGLGVVAQGNGGQPHAGGDTAAPFSPSPLSLLLGGHQGMAVRTPPGSSVVLPSEERGSAPFVYYSPPIFFCVSWLLAHSTKTANPISQPPIPTRSLNDHLSTIHSQNTSRFNLINIELHLRSTT